jgi:hypothetical protein
MRIQGGIDERTRQLAPYLNRQAILLGTSAPFRQQSSTDNAAATANDGMHARWKLQPAMAVLNDPIGADQADRIPMDHVNVMSAYPVHTDERNMHAFLKPDNASLASYPVTNAYATSDPGYGTEVRVPVAITHSMRGDPNIIRPNTSPGVFNDTLAADAINIALSGAPNTAIRRRVDAISTTYDDLAERRVLYYMANDAIARQLIERAGAVPLSEENARVLRMAGQRLASLPMALPSPYGL